jgi:1,2-phenylacetyl-CoA epoxidase PaaB subunit
MNGRSYYDEPVRRVDTVSILSMGENNLVAQTLAAREITEKEFIYPSEKSLYGVLSNKFAIKNNHIFDEITRREAFLRELNNSRISSHEDVRKTIVDYYQS